MRALVEMHERCVLEPHRRIRLERNHNTKPPEATAPADPAAPSRHGRSATRPPVSRPSSLPSDLEPSEYDRNCPAGFLCRRIHHLFEEIVCL